MELVEANWLLVVIAVLIGLAIAWYVFHVKRTTRITGDRRDVLDDGAERAGRNQALIDSPRDAPDPVPAQTRKAEDEVGVAPITAPTGLAGAGPAVAAGAMKSEADIQQSQRTALNDEVASAEWQNTEQAAASESVPAATSPIAASEDDLTRIKGVGAKLSARLNELGITSLSQIAAWNNADIERIDPQLGRFEGRIRRDDWVRQAQLLLSGDMSAYENRFGKT